MCVRVRVRETKREGECERASVCERDYRERERECV